MSHSVKLVCVDPKRTYEVWPHVEHFIKPAFERTGEMIMVDVLRMLFAGRFLMWLIWDGEKIAGAVITEITDTMKGRVCVIVALGGKDRNRWMHLLSEIEEYALLEGCKSVRLYGRKGWKRVLRDYRETRVILEKEI